MGGGGRQVEACSVAAVSGVSPPTHLPRANSVQELALSSPATVGQTV